MTEDRPEQTAPSPEPGRAKRPPPTIELEASEVSGETQGGGGQPRGSFARFFAQALPFTLHWPSSAALTATLGAALSGAVTAVLVIALAWLVGWPGETAPQPTSPPTDVSVIDALASRVADLETRAFKSPAAADPALASRLEALEKSLAALRAEIAAARAQSEKLAADLNAVKSAPPATSSPELAAISERLSQVERATRADTAQRDNKPADDTALRRVVVASMLDVAVRQGDPFAAQLAAAKLLAPNPEALKPLDDFAASGVPHPAALSRELLALVPKLSPPAKENATTGTGIIDRLQAGAAKLVRIERTDIVGNDRNAVIARVTAAALRNDYAEARRELNILSASERAAAQAWLDRANAHDAALAASHQFATEAMAALVKSAP